MKIEIKKEDLQKMMQPNINVYGNGVQKCAENLYAQFGIPTNLSVAVTYLGTYCPVPYPVGTIHPIKMCETTVPASEAKSWMHYQLETDQKYPCMTSIVQFKILPQNDDNA